jgi:hypothetical protein
MGLPGGGPRCRDPGWISFRLCRLFQGAIECCGEALRPPNLVKCRRRVNLFTGASANRGELSDSSNLNSTCSLVPFLTLGHHLKPSNFAFYHLHPFVSSAFQQPLTKVYRIMLKDVDVLEFPNEHTTVEQALQGPDTSFRGHVSEAAVWRWLALPARVAEPCY